MAIQGAPASTPMPYTPTTFGWLSWAAVLASRAKRWNVFSSAAMPAGRTLSATRRSSDACHASYTTPIPPRPIRRRRT
ncbi:MAG: hypothetical protein HY721_00360 [Planctomycetes bacterium]|nr:hypothetical protein [Planctomycetota bacterium]